MMKNQMVSEKVGQFLPIGLPLAIMPSADRVPVKSSHSTMLWPEWVVPITGSTSSALHTVCPFQPFFHAIAGAIAFAISAAGLPRKRHGFLITLTFGHHRPSHPGELIGKRNGRDLCGPPVEQRCQPRPVLGAVLQRIFDDGQGTGTRTRIGDTGHPPW
jgi:hypothetical protein